MKSHSNNNLIKVWLGWVWLGWVKFGQDGLGQGGLGYVVLGLVKLGWVRLGYNVISKCWVQCARSIKIAPLEHKCQAKRGTHAEPEGV